MSAAIQIEEELRAHEEKELVRFVVVGSVDDGKSTLIGRLLFEANGLYEDQIAQVKRASKQGGDEIDFSLFTDGLKAEREQAITIDVAYRYFATEKRKFIIADTPGHVQYTRNMATGASTADIAIILIDARLGLQAQTRRHAYIARLLGIRHLAVAINKMDLVAYDEQAFSKIKADFLSFAAPLGFTAVDVFPISARSGDNVVTASARMPWHQGGTILSYLERVPVLRHAASEAFRFPVQYVIRPHLEYRGFAGQIVSGQVQAGDEVVVLPSGQRTRVRSIDVYEGSVPAAIAPSSVVLRLTDEVDVGRGDLIAHVSTQPRVLRELDAHLVWLHTTAMDPEKPYLVKHTTRAVPGRIESVGWKLNLETLAHEPAKALGLNEIGKITLKCTRPLVADPYDQNRATGAFILIDPVSNATVAAGMIIGAKEGGANLVSSDVPRVSAAERRLRLGHASAIVYIERESSEIADAAATALERALFDQHLLATVVTNAAEAAIACASAGLVVAFIAPRDPEARSRALATLRLSGEKLIESREDEPLSQIVGRVGAT
ncbi:MAG: sulfate adenylyltransferase subunit 1 [Myxococcaceae bacterium]